MVQKDIDDLFESIDKLEGIVIDESSRATQGDSVMLQQGTLTLEWLSEIRDKVNQRQDVIDKILKYQNIQLIFIGTVCMALLMKIFMFW